MSVLPVVGQDPRFGDGAWAQAAAFLEGARALGREPELLYRPHPSLAPMPLPPGATEPASPDLLIRAQTAWVVATAASYGEPARRSGRPYGCWIGTSLAAEWRGRRPGLGVARRAALELHAPRLRRVERRVLAAAARVYATSPASRDAVAAAAGREDVGLLPIPVDVERFAPEDDDAWLARLDAPTLLFVGRADDPRKHVELLLAAYERLRVRVPGARLRLVGEPPRGTPGAGVEVLGRVPCVADVLRDASLFVLPSRQEGFGIAAAEALACGVPVVTTPSGGPEELVRASGGGVVLEAHDATELAETAVELLGDAARLAAMRRGGRDHVVEHHSPARFRLLLADALAAVDSLA